MEAASRLLTASEETLKRNTDCIYFLASPLTCKKGRECEYRHSEAARVNPRDCRYWLIGGCLNLKCAFRHPRLDGLVENPGTTSVTVPSLQTVSTAKVFPALLACSNINKQSVPCRFFPKGLCLKGDKCPFIHGPKPTGAPAAQQLAMVSASATLASQQNIPKASVDKPVQVAHSTEKPVAKAGSVPDNHFVLERSLKPPRSQPANFPGRDADELVVESSPGYDVVVDDDNKDSDYFRNVDDFRRESAQGGRSLYRITDFNYRHSDCEPVISLEGGQYNGVDEHDRYRLVEQRRTSLERMPYRGLIPDRRVLRREDSPDMDGSDLCHRLLKRKRINGSRSTGEPYHRNDERYQSHSHKDQRRFPRESSISTRLQGRITLPVGPSPVPPVDPRSDRERDRVRSQGRISSVTPASYQGTLHDRINRRPHNNFTVDARKERGQPIRRGDADPINFTGPKSLAELKGAKVSENSQELPSKNISTTRPSLPFEGPKPLSDILKRKIEAAPENGTISSNENESSSASAAASDPQYACSSVAEKGNHIVSSIKEPRVRPVEDEEEEGVISSDGKGGQSSSKDTVEIKDAMVDSAEDGELNEELDSEAMDVDVEAVENGDVYLDEYEVDGDDEDDFAKRVGVMFS